MLLSPQKPIAGLLTPLFALRSDHDLGIGDTDALRELVVWARSLGFSLVQLLPINETGNDHSPYNAISSVALDPATLALTPERLPDLDAADHAAILAESDLPTLRKGPVDYARVKPLKRRLLEAAFARFEARAWRTNARRAREFRLWCGQQAGWLEGYTLFRALMDENGGSEMWDHWPSPQQTLASARAWLAALPSRQRREWERRERYHAYVQWIAFAQWEALRQFAEDHGVALMGDVPIGVSYYGADVFSQPELFDLRWSGGAPPERVFHSDPFTEKWGQNWGVPMYRWERHRESGFAWWRQRVARVRNLFHLFRVDHVLGFYRMYGFPWRPRENEAFLPLSEDEARERTGGPLPHFIPHDDDTQAHRDANRHGGEAILRVLLEETGPHRLIGEDLGVVPDYVRPSLHGLGIAGFKIPQWERRPDWSLIPGGEYERLSIATYATHDHPPLAAYWDGMCDAAWAGDEHQRWELHRLMGFAGVHEERRYDDGIRESLLGALLRSNAWIAVTMITDLLGSRKRFNVPGSVAQTNWSERLNRTVAQWSREETLRLEGIVRLLRESGRA